MLHYDKLNYRKYLHKFLSFPRSFHCFFSDTASCQSLFFVKQYDDNNFGHKSKNPGLP